MEEKEEIPEVKNPAHLLAKRLQENRKSLHIARVPDKTRVAFIRLAEEEFCGDYGMALKWLIDDTPSQDMRLVILKLEEFEMRLQNLESTSVSKEKEEPKTRTLKMVDGSKKTIREVEKHE